MRPSLLACLAFLGAAEATFPGFAPQTSDHRCQCYGRCSTSWDSKEQAWCYTGNKKRCKPARLAPFRSLWSFATGRKGHYYDTCTPQAPFTLKKDILHKVAERLPQDKRAEFNTHVAKMKAGFSRP